MSSVQEEHFVGKIAQKVIVEQDDKLLLVQDPREERDIWELPGGRMNVDENPYKAIQREFLEEMGVEIDIHEVVYMKQFIQGNEGARAFVIVYRATLVDETASFSLEEHEVSKVEWFTKSEINSLALYPEYEEAIQVYFATKNV